MGIRDFMKNILFEEEEDEEEYEEEEEEEEEPQPVRRKAPRVEVSQRTVSRAPSPAPSPSPASVSSSPAPARTARPTQTLTVNEASSTTTIFGDLDMDNVSLSDQELSQRPSKAGRRRNYLERRVVNREYEPVLSPIFGNVEEKERQLAQVHNAINLPKPSADFDMVQIISPIYGRQNVISEPVDTRKGKRITPTESKPKAEEPIEYDEQAFAVISTRNVQNRKQSAEAKQAASDGFEQAARGKHLSKSRRNREQKAQPELEPAAAEETYPAIEPEPEPLTESIEKIDLKTFLSKKPKK